MDDGVAERKREREIRRYQSAAAYFRTICIGTPKVEASRLYGASARDGTGRDAQRWARTADREIRLDDLDDLNTQARND
jgi:hypothetical protein